MLEHPVYFLNLKHLSKETFMYHLNQLLFYEKPPEFLNFHYNENDRERSILISEDGISVFESLVDLESIRKYSCASIINTFDYIDDTGLVKTLSTAFGEANIPILYITTLNNNFILFDHSHFERSMGILNSLTKIVVFSPFDGLV